MEFKPLDVVRFFRQLGMNKRDKAEELVREQMLWSLGAGLVPVPILDIAAVTAVQVRMLQKLTDLYEVPFDESKGKALVTGLIGSTLASIGASVVKAIPLVGALVGGAGMAILSAASTYAIGQTFIRHFEGGGNLDNFDVTAARKVYEEELERGKEYANRMQREFAQRKKGAPDAASAAADAVKPEDDVFVKLEKLSQLRDKGVITEAEFQTKKQQLLQTL